MKVAIVGGGVMGEAILSAALDSGVFAASDVTVIEKVEARRESIAASYQVSVAEGYAAMSEADLVLLSVKPQEMGSVAGKLKADGLLLSIMAGIKMSSIAKEFGHDRVVRVMPNTPAAMKVGMSGWTAMAAVTDEQKATVRALLGAIGSELYFEDEKKLDMVTAVSGSGPAYVFLFIEAMIDGAVAVGLPRAAAEEMVLQTLYGSALYVRQSGKSAAELRAMVTSPAGTTAAGLIELEKGAFRASVIECIRAAHQRAIDLGNA